MTNLKDRLIKTAKKVKADSERKKALLQKAADQYKALKPE